MRWMNDRIVNYRLRRSLALTVLDQRHLRRYLSEGLTLVELLIAAAIGLVVIAGIGSALPVSEVRVSGVAVLPQTLKG